jgi:hypothetical protein
MVWRKSGEPRQATGAFGESDLSPHDARVRHARAIRKRQSRGEISAKHCDRAHRRAAAPVDLERQPLELELALAK